MGLMQSPAYNFVVSIGALTSLAVSVRVLGVAVFAPCVRHGG